MHMLVLKPTSQRPPGTHLCHTKLALLLVTMETISPGKPWGMPLKMTLKPVFFIEFWLRIAGFGGE